MVGGGVGVGFVSDCHGGVADTQNDRDQGICQAMKWLQTEQLVGDIVSKESVIKRPGGSAWGKFWVGFGFGVALFWFWGNIKKFPVHNDSLIY